MVPSEVHHDDPRRSCMEHRCGHWFRTVPAGVWYPMWWLIAERFWAPAEVGAPDDFTRVVR